MARILIDSATSKTGILLKDSGARDEHGMQPLDDVFSSPDKDSRNGADELDEDESEEEPMDIDEGEFGTKWDTSARKDERLLTQHSNRTSTLRIHERPTPRSRAIAAKDTPEVARPPRAWLFVITAPGRQSCWITLWCEGCAETA